MTTRTVVRVRNPSAVPVDVPGYGVLNAGAEADGVDGPRLRRKVRAGSLEVVDGSSTSRASSGFDGMSVEDLESEVERRGLEVDGTGKDGRVVKADLVRALEADEG